jgi:uncharacterized protein YdaU (DUF1376 family)
MRAIIRTRARMRAILRTTSMKFYKRDPDRALAGMAELTLKQRGAYNSLLDLLYSRDGDVPDDDQRVARMICCHQHEWKAAKAQLMALGMVWSENGKLMALRVQETIREATEFAQTQRIRIAGRWQKSELPNDINDATIPRGNTNTVIVTPTVTPRPKVSKDTFGARSAPATRWPADAIIPGTWISDAARSRAAHGLPDIDLRLEAQRFVNYWASKGGRDAAKLDWSKTWINWALRAEGARNGKNAHDGKKQTAHDRFLAGAAAFIRDELAGTETDLHTDPPADSGAEGGGGAPAFAARHPLLPP